MNPMIKSFNENSDGKMSSSEANTKIDLMDRPKSIRKKVGKAYLPEKNIDNGLFEFLEKVIWKYLKDQNKNILFQRHEKYGGNIEFKNIDELKTNILNGNVHPVDLKQYVSKFLIDLLEPLRELNNDETFVNISENAY